MNDREGNSAFPTPPPVGWAAPLLDVVLALLRSARWSAALGGVSVLAVLAAYVARKPYYQVSASAVLLGREKPLLDARVTTDSLATTSDQAGRADGGHQLIPQQVKLYTSLVGARATLCGVIRRVPELGAESDEVLRDLASSLRAETTDEGLVTVTVTADTPRLAADLANAVLLEVQAAMATVESELNVRQLTYLETSLNGVSSQLADAEHDLARFCSLNRVVAPRVQAERHARMLNEAIAARDRSEAAVRTRAVHFADGDPELQQLRARLRSQDEQVRRLREEVVGQSGEREFGHLVVTYDGLAEAISDLRDLRQVLTAQVRLQRLRVESPPSYLAVLRPASPPLLPAGPSKRRFLAVGAGVWLVGTLALAVLFAQWRSALRYSWVRRRRRQIYRLLPFARRPRRSVSCHPRARP